MMRNGLAKPKTPFQSIGITKTPARKERHWRAIHRRKAPMSMESENSASGTLFRSRSFCSSTKGAAGFIRWLEVPTDNRRHFGLSRWPDHQNKGMALLGFLPASL